GLHLIPAQAGSTHISRASRTPTYDNVVIEADLRKIDGPNDFGYGIVFREVDDGFYSFQINGNGEYYLGHWLWSTRSWEIAVPWKAPPAIRPGNATNTLRAVLRGPNVSVSVNGQALADWRDPTASPPPGTIGVISGRAGLHFVATAVRVAP